MSVVRYHTQTGSIYEIDYAADHIRRVSGEQEPTERIGEDGVWKPFMTVMVETAGILVIWGVEDGILRTTITSPVVEVEEVPSDHPAA